jgi:phage gp46-like protein
MPQDVLIKPDGFGNYDIPLNENGYDFASAEGFESAIPVSLFTDARAPASSVADPKKRRGWIGNLLTIDQDRQLGGLLWIYDQGRITATLLNGVRNETLRSLNWMLADGILLSIEVDVFVESTRAIRVKIRLTGTDNNVDQYSVLWRRTNPAQITSGF